MKVLIVEDDEFTQREWAEELKDKDVTILQALTIEEAERIFSEHADIDVIAMDACIPDVDWPTTIPLVKKMRQTYAGPMIAMSSNGSFNEMLQNAGCDYQCGKRMVPRTILRIGGLS